MKTRHITRSVFLMFLILSSTSWGISEDDIIDPENKQLKEAGIEDACEEEEASTCMDALLIWEHKKRDIHGGVDYSTFISELTTGDWVSPLEEAWRQSQVSMQNDYKITDNLSKAIMTNVQQGERSIKLNVEMNSAGNAFGEYGKMLYLTYRQLMVEYKIQSALTDALIKEEEENEIISLEAKY